MQPVQAYRLPFRFCSMDILAATIRKVFERKGYRFFDNGKPFNLNLFGVRYPDGINEWSDQICVLYRDDRLNWVLWQTQGTTKSGLDGLRKPVNKKGTGILVPGQYLGAYRLDKHKGKSLAICQRLKPVSVYRDNNMDGVLDMDSTKIESGFFGINIHSPFSDKETVGRKSVACQVPSTVGAWNKLLALAKKAARLHGNVFSYTLLESEDFADLQEPGEPPV